MKDPAQQLSEDQWYREFVGSETSEAVRTERNCVRDDQVSKGEREDSHSSLLDDSTAQPDNCIMQALCSQY